MVRIRLADETEAFLQAGRWHVANARLESLLNAMVPPWYSAEENLEYYEAKLVVKVLGGEIIETV